MIHSYRELQRHVDSLDQGDYLIQVVDRAKKGSHDLYTKVVSRDKIMQVAKELEALAPVWEDLEGVVPVAYMSNVRIDQHKGYEALLRAEATKLLQGNSIKQRILSTTKPAYLGMLRDYYTLDIDLGDCPSIEVEADLVELAVDVNALGWEARLTKTHGGYHLTVSAAAQRMVHQTLQRLDLDTFVDKTGKDVMSPMPGSVQKGHEVTRLV